MEGVTLDRYIEKGVFLSELGETSCLRMKKIKEKHDGDMCLVQLTVENHAIVFNLQPENRYEVALVQDIHTFQDPIKFAMTGYEFKTKRKRLVVNKNHSLGFELPILSKGYKGLIRPYAEIDLK